MIAKWHAHAVTAASRVHRTSPVRPACATPRCGRLAAPCFTPESSRGPAKAQRRRALDAAPRRVCSEESASGAQFVRDLWRAAAVEPPNRPRAEAAAPPARPTFRPMPAARCGARHCHATQRRRRRHSPASRRRTPCSANHRSRSAPIARSSTCLPPGRRRGHRSRAASPSTLHRRRAAAQPGWPSAPRRCWSTSSPSRSAACTATGAARGCARAVVRADQLDLHGAGGARHRPGDAVQRRVQLRDEAHLAHAHARRDGQRPHRAADGAAQPAARGFNTRKFAICGVNKLGVQLARNIQNSPELGLRVRRLLRRPPRAPHQGVRRRRAARTPATSRQLVRAGQDAAAST